MAEDLTSMVFLESWRKRDRLCFVGESALPWLLGVATNVSRNNRRSFYRYRDLVDRLPRSEPFSDEFERVTDRLVAETQMTTLLGRMERLPPDEFDVVALCGWSGLDYASAAVALDIPIGTVRSRLARARKRLASGKSEKSERSEKSRKTTANAELRTAAAHNKAERHLTLRRMED